MRYDHFHLPGHIDQDDDVLMALGVGGGFRVSLTGSEWLVGAGLLVEVVAVLILHDAQSYVLKNWGYSNPHPDALKRATKHSSWGWSFFSAGLLLQLAGLLFG